MLSLTRLNGKYSFCLKSFKKENTQVIISLNELNYLEF